nr:unnamed protein product [Digitaria exilis]
MDRHRETRSIYRHLRAHRYPRAAPPHHAALLRCDASLRTTQQTSDPLFFPHNIITFINRAASTHPLFSPCNARLTLSSSPHSEVTFIRPHSERPILSSSVTKGSLSSATQRAPDLLFLPCNTRSPSLLPRNTVTFMGHRSPSLLPRNTVTFMGHVASTYLTLYSSPATGSLSSAAQRALDPLFFPCNTHVLDPLFFPCNGVTFIGRTASARPSLLALQRSPSSATGVTFFRCNGVTFFVRAASARLFLTCNVRSPGDSGGATAFALPPRLSRPPDWRWRWPRPGRGLVDATSAAMDDAFVQALKHQPLDYREPKTNSRTKSPCWILAAGVQDHDFMMRAPDLDRPPTQQAGTYEHALASAEFGKPAMAAGLRNDEHAWVVFLREARDNVPSALRAVGAATCSVAVRAAAAASSFSPPALLIAAAAFFGGVTTIYAALWVEAGDASRRRTGQLILCAALVPLLAAVVAAADDGDDYYEFVLDIVGAMLQGTGLRSCPPPRAWWDRRGLLIVVCLLVPKLETFASCRPWACVLLAAGRCSRLARVQTLRITGIDLTLSRSLLRPLCCCAPSGWWIRN